MLSRTLAVPTVIFALALAATAASGQNLQTGTKPVPEMIVAYVTGTSEANNVRDDIAAQMGQLFGAALQAGLHPIPLPMLAMDLAGLDPGAVVWEARFALADRLDPAKLPQNPGCPLKCLPACTVAYTYHPGDPVQMQAAFERLALWAHNQNLPLTTRARAILYTFPDQGRGSEVMTECQLELKQ